MNDSVLLTIKEMLGVPQDQTAFDTEILTHINSAFFTLNQLGIGPKESFVIEGKDDLWLKFVDDINNLASVKTYIYLKVRLLFDPPQNSFITQAFEEQCKEYAWRLNFKHEVDINE